MNSQVIETSRGLQIGIPPICVDDLDLKIEVEKYLKMNRVKGLSYQMEHTTHKSQNPVDTLDGIRSRHIDYVGTDDFDLILNLDNLNCKPSVNILENKF